MKNFKKSWKKFRQEWDLTAILLFFIPFLFVLFLFLCAPSSEGELRSGEKRFFLFDGTRPIDLYAGTTAISKHTSPPAITAFSASPSTIDLDTRPSGTIAFTLAVTGTPGTNTPTASNMTFLEVSGHNWFVNSVNPPTGQGFGVQGSRSIANVNLGRIAFYNSSYALSNWRNEYHLAFLPALTKLKTPLNMKIGDNSYPLNYQVDLSSRGTPYYQFETGTIPSGDRISSSSLTKAINIELVDNIQADFFNNGNSVSINSNLPSGVTGSVNFQQGNNRYRLNYTGSKTPTHLLLNGREYALNALSATSWLTSTSAATNLRPSSSIPVIGINVKFSDGTYANNTRTWLYNTVSGGITYAQIVRLPNGANVGATFVSSAGANISSTLPNIPQPQSTTTYRLIASNSGGHSHRDTTVTVTKNPTLTNCRRTGYIDATTQYQFGFTLTGLPRPTVTYVFSGGQQGTVSDRHLVQGSNPYTWTSSGWQIVFANANAQSLTLTATNASGSSTCTISNINN